MIIYLKKRRRVLGFIAFTAPAVLLILLMSEIPFLMDIYYSFMRWNGMSAATWNHFSNFKELFTDDSAAFDASIFTLKYTIATTIAVNVLAILLAIILNQGLRLRSLLRILFFLPFVLSFLCTAYMWKFIFTKGFEILNALTGWEIFNWSWLGNPKLAVSSVIIVSVWRLVGYNMIIYIAGLQTIPSDVIEAADFDGATRLQKVTKIILPLLMPSITIGLFLSITLGLNIFDIPFALTNGGPGTSTTGIAMNIYHTAFTDNRFGYAAAKSLVFFFVATTIAFVQVGITKKREVEA